MKNLKQKVAGALVAAPALLATTAANAGPLLEAAKAEMEPVKADLNSGSGMVIGVALIAVGVGLMIRLMRKA